MYRATEDLRVRCEFLLISSAQVPLYMVIHIKLEVMVVTNIYSGDFTALLTIIRH
ncbi:hypothetical protein H6G06_11710 [Anabaena sphaerica FACHB-251]|uniref:Uncharacterized protein n=1 Tax=Anabaena sphaerica FACHB-251 TaxID=2692883 RepID=A0A926WHA8_9NOST|nr:hypothetical protein [Anabaena sphaerica FACHB-251]